MTRKRSLRCLPAAALVLTLAGIDARAALPDLCALLPAADVAAVAGTPVTAKPQPAEGNWLGSCDYERKDGNGVASLKALALADYDGFLGYLRKNGVKLKPAPDFGARAVNSESGLLLQPEGKDYGLLLTVADVKTEGGMVSMENNPAKQLKLGKKLKP